MSSQQITKQTVSQMEANEMSQQSVGLIGQRAVAQLPIDRIVQQVVGQFVQEPLAQINISDGGRK